MKKIAIIPTLFTLGNGVCGFAAIVIASKVSLDNLAYSAFFIIAAMIFDMLDGYLARLSRSASEFGGQLDSLCDVISFGVAPAFLLLRLGEVYEHISMLHHAVAGIAGLYMVCALLRLARFNVESSPDPASHKRFKGLPSTAAAGCLASLAIMRSEPTLGPWIALDRELLRECVKFLAPGGALLLALLMVSRFPYPHLTKQLLRGRRHFSYLIRIVLAGFVIVFTGELAIVLIFWTYALLFPSYYLVVRMLHRRALPAPGLEDGLRR